MCSTTLAIFTSLTTLWTLVLCSKLALSFWHVKSCLQGNYLKCGVKNLKICPRELQCDKLINWKSIGYEMVGKIDDGKDKKAQKVEYHETQPQELLQYLTPCLKEFILHNYVYRWQDLQF